MGTVNVYSGIQDMLPVLLDPGAGYLDIGLGYAYGIWVQNPTSADITTGTLTFEGADAKADNPCEPDVWAPLDPVEDCGPLVTGVPYTPPVTIDITPDRPIRAHSSCAYAIPCPRQFLRVTGAPAGTHVIGVVSRLKRTNFDHYGPWGGIPMPLPQPFGLAAPLQAPATQPGQARQQPQQQPQQQPAQQRR